MSANAVNWQPPHRRRDLYKRQSTAMLRPIKDRILICVRRQRRVPQPWPCHDCVVPGPAAAAAAMEAAALRRQLRRSPAGSGGQGRGGLGPAPSMTALGRPESARGLARFSVLDPTPWACQRRPAVPEGSASQSCLIEFLIICIA